MDFEDVTENVDSPQQVEQEGRTSPDLEALEQNQQEERDYFAKKEEKINATKEKLQTLLERLQEQPEKDTISKKILRLRIDRLRSKLDRRMAKFDIEYLADLEENADYDQFRDECDVIRDRINELEDLEEKLEVRLETYTRLENYRGVNRANLDSKIQKMAPKGQRKAQTVKNSPRKSKATQTREHLEKVRAEINDLEAELKEKIADYKNYKEYMKAQTKAEVKETMQGLKEAEAQLRQQRKEELAVTKPSLWAKIRGGIKTQIDKINAWNERRKSEKAQRAEKKDEMVSNSAADVLTQRTARQKFMEEQEADPETRAKIAQTVRRYQDRENFEETVPEQESEKESEKE